MEWRFPFPFRLSSMGIIYFFVGARTLPIHYWDCICILLQSNISFWAKQSDWNLLILSLSNGEVFLKVLKTKLWLSVV